MSSEMMVMPQLDLAALERAAQQLAQSKYSAERNPVDALWLVATGAGLGIDPATALRAIHVIKGKPVLSADLMSAVAMRHPACEYLIIREMSAERCVIATKRRGWPEEVVMTWTMEDARRAGLAGGDNWKKYPQAMLKARCLGQIVRAAYPDALMGVYAEGEIEETAEAAPEAINITPPKSAEQTTREQCIAQLRTWLTDAALGKATNKLITDAIIQRCGGDEDATLQTVDVGHLYNTTQALRLAIDEHGLETALRDLTEWAPALIEGGGAPIERSLPTPA